MNKKKTTTYILLLAVVAVWGLIVFRVIKGTRVPPLKINKEKTGITPKRENIKDKDYKLLLDYPDPFLKNMGKNKQEQSAADANTNIAQEKGGKASIEKKIRLEYQGCIERKDSKDIVGLVVENGKSRIVRVGDNLDENCTVEALLKDSILVRTSGGLLYIRKKKR